MIASLILAARLCGALVGPEVDTRTACEAALPIVVVCGDRAALCAAIAYRESRYRSTAINPRTGAAGLMQVVVRGPRRRAALARSAWDGVAAGLRKLDEAAAFCGRRRAGTWTPHQCQLAGYVAGPRGVRALQSGARWPRALAAAILRRAARIQRAINGWQASC